MAKAALEAMNGLNMFGSQGSSLSIIHVDPDAQYRNCVILNNLLPRESSSKETDASLLFISGFPAFSIDDANIRKQTEQRTKELLGVRVRASPRLYSKTCHPTMRPPCLLRPLAQVPMSPHHSLLTTTLRIRCSNYFTVIFVPCK